MPFEAQLPGFQNISTSAEIQSNTNSKVARGKCQNRRMNRVHPTPSGGLKSAPKYHLHYRRNRIQETMNPETAEDGLDISFLLTYARYLTAELKEYELQKNAEPLSKSRSIELAYQVLMVFQEHPAMNDFHRNTRRMVFQYLDRLMENFGLQFLDHIAQLLILQSKIREAANADFPLFTNIEEISASSLNNSIVDVEANPEKKLIIFIEDNPPEYEATRLARMLIVSLLACNIQPLVIPCNDLDNGQLENLKLRLTQCYFSTCYSCNSAKISNDKNIDYRILLKMGFLASLDTPEKQVLVFDVDRRLKDYNDFIAEAEYRGHQLLFMRYHSGINKLKFVQKIIRKILFKLHPNDIAMNLNFSTTTSSTIVTSKDYVVEVDLQDSNNGVVEIDVSPVLKKNGPTLRSFFRFVTERIPRFPWSSSPEEQEKLEILQSLSAKRPKSVLPFTRREQNLQLQSGLFSLSRIFSENGSNNGLENKSQDYEEIPSAPQPAEAFNRNILPRFTDEQFERIFVKPKIYGRQCEEIEAKLFSHTKRDLDDLDEIFADNVKSNESDTDHLPRFWQDNNAVVVSLPSDKSEIIDETQNSIVVKKNSTFQIKKK